MLSSTSLLLLLLLSSTLTLALPPQSSWNWSNPWTSWGSHPAPPAAPAPAWPSPSPAWPGSPTPCISDADATIVATNFGLLISNYSATLAEAFLADNYVDQADSVNSLIDGGQTEPIPLGSDTFASKAAFLAGQGAQPNVPFQVSQVWHTCDWVILRWVSKQTPQQVQGIDVLNVVPQTNETAKAISGDWQIAVTYGEFNSMAWGTDAGCTITCPPPPSMMMRM